MRRFQVIIYFKGINLKICSPDMCGCLFFWDLTKAMPPKHQSTSSSCVLSDEIIVRWRELPKTSGGKDLHFSVFLTVINQTTASQQSAGLYRKHTEDILHHLHPCVAPDCCLQSVCTRTRTHTHKGIIVIFCLFVCRIHEDQYKSKD